MSRSEFDSAMRETRHGGVKVIVTIAFLFVVGGIIFGAIGYVGGWFSEGGRVLQEEFGPEAAVRKYEWFKDAAAAIQEKQATIEVYEAQLSVLVGMQEDSGNPRRNRDRDRRIEQLSMELLGLKASFNRLVAQYNANHAKINWKFADQGDLPKQFEVYLIQ